MLMSPTTKLRSYGRISVDFTSNFSNAAGAVRGPAKAAFVD